MSEFRKTVGFVGEFIRPFRRHFLFVFAATIALQVIGLVPPLLLGKFVDALTAKSGMREIIFISLAFFLVALLRNAVTLVKEIREVRFLDFRLPEASANLSLTRMLGFSLGQHANENSGLRTSVLGRGENAVIQLANRIIYEAFPTVVLFVVTCAAVFCFSFWLGVIALSFVAVHLSLTVFMFRRLFPRIQEMRDTNNENHRFKSEVLRNATLVGAHAQEAKVTDDLAGRLSDFSEKAATVWVSFYWFYRLRELLPALMGAVTLGVGALFVMRGELSIGEAVALLSWSGMMIGSLNNIAVLQRHLTEDYVALEAYIRMLQIPVAVTEVQNPITPAVGVGEIRIENVWFSYPPAPKEKKNENKKTSVKVADDEDKVTASPRRILSGVSFVIPAGKTTAIVGPSGAGKSTLAQILLRGYDPDEGRIRVDGNDMRFLGLKSLRSSFGYVEQNVKLFDDTLLANILFGVIEKERAAAMARLPDVLKKSHLDGFVAQLPLGLDSKIGEEGIRLSGGERQRVGIARALIKDPKVILFDEATSQLDGIAEGIIHDAMKNALVGRTGIVIAHRLSTICEADQIVVVNDGRIDAVGAHEELMSTSPIYGALVRRQIIAGERLRLVA